MPLYALPDEVERLAEGLALDWDVLVGAAGRLAVGDAVGRLPPAVPVEGRAPTLPVEGFAPTFPVDGRAPALPVEGMPVEGRAPALPVEGMPVEGRAPAFAPPPCPEPQPRASRVLAEAPPAPLVPSRFWSGCHFCAGCWLGRLPLPDTFPELFTLALRELFTLTFRELFTLMLL